MPDLKRKQLYEQFQEVFPMEKLKDMPLEQYTNLNKDDSFCYWIESRTEHLGSIWGGSSYKFGIYKYNQSPSKTDPRITFDENYVWYKKFNKATSAEAYELVRDSIVRIAECASKGDLKSIEEIKTLGDSFKWKVAFLYSNEKLIPIFNRSMLETVAEKLGMDHPEHSSISEIQQFFISNKGDRDLYDFYDELLQILEKKSTQATEQKKYWIYAPGEGASKWQLCQDAGMMCIGWDEMGDLSRFNSLEEIKVKLQDVYAKSDSSFKQAGLALWEFSKVIKPGDVVFAKLGREKIIGRGIVRGNYVYDEQYNSYRNVISVDWIQVGEWDAPRTSVTKTLTDITKSSSYVKDLENLFFEKTNKQYWWLVANPKIWSLENLKVGEVQDYTLYTENGNKSMIFPSFCTINSPAS